MSRRAVAFVWISATAFAAVVFLALIPLAHEVFHDLCGTEHHAQTCPLATLARALPAILHGAVAVAAAAVLLGSVRPDRGAVYAPAPVFPTGRPRAPPLPSF
jgi:hypothetical protein